MNRTRTEGAEFAPWRGSRRKAGFAAALIAAVSFATSALALSEVKLLDPFGDANDRFGAAVALSGNDAIVGAPSDETQGSLAGKAVVYHFNGASWQVEGHLYPPAPSASARFGFSVAISGDYAIVGAPHPAITGADTGTATLFHRVGSTWSQQDTLLGSDTALDDDFGTAVAIDGDYAVVGAPLHDAQGTDSGAAYVFLRNGTNWQQQAKLLPTFGASETFFGYDVDLSGARAIVARANANEGPASAYVFERTGVLWSEQAATTGAHLVTANDTLSIGLALSGDRMLIGAYSHQHLPSHGAAYAFGYNPASLVWSEQKEFVEPSGGPMPDLLSWSVGLDGQLGAVGAPFGNAAQPDAGLVYFYQDVGDDTWSQVAKVSASDGFQNQEFGQSVDVSGGCGIVGAHGEDANGALSGAAYVYCGVPLLAVRVSFDILCCFKIPDYTTGPVEFELRFTNFSDQPQSVQRWVELLRPDGDVVEVAAPADVDVPIGATVVEALSTQITAGSPLGNYGLVTHWIDSEGEHTEMLTFEVVDESALIPALPGVAPLVMAAALIGTAGWTLRRRYRTG